MLLDKVWRAALLGAVAVQEVVGMPAMAGKPNKLIQRGPLLQDIVTWDEVC